MKFIFKLILSFLSVPLLGIEQTKQKDLEQRKKALLEQIKQMSALRQQQSQQRKSTIQQVGEVNERVLIRTRLVQINQQQTNFLSKEIADSEDQLHNLKKEFIYHKDECAKIIVQLYRNKSTQSRLLFLLSSESFSQAYKRLSYMRQHANYRKKQVGFIQTKTDEIKNLDDTLVTQYNEKNQVFDKQQREQATLQQEKRELEQLATNIREVERSYESQIREEQKQANAIDREIQRLVRLAIIGVNKRKQKNNASGMNATDSGMVTTTPPSADNTAKVTFVLTPESRKVADSFKVNKDNLIWPVAKGCRAQGFEVYYNPVYPELQHYNNGVTIATKKRAETRCVFKGGVSAIQSILGSNKVVQVRHGSYITIYYNLINVYVRKGDKVKAKDPLGKIFTNANGKTEMKLFLYKNTTRLNPGFRVHKI